MNKFKVLILSILFVSQSSSAGPRTDCSALLSRILSELTNRANVKEQVETVFKRDLHYLRIDSSQLKNGKISASKLDSENAIFIGIQRNGHMYIVAGKNRFDGDFISNTPTLKKSDLLSDGVVVRVEDSNGSLQKGVVDYFNENGPPKSLNCVSGICKVIGRSSDLTVSERHISAVFPHNFLKRVVNHGFETPDTNIIDLEIFILGDQSLKSLVSSVASQNFCLAVTG